MLRRCHIHALGELRKLASSFLIAFNGMQRRKYFAGRRQSTTCLWTIMFQNGGEVVLTQAISEGPLDLDALRQQLKLLPTAMILAELAR